MKKHYPTTAHRAAASRQLLAVLRRAPSRPARFRRQVQRRRPWLLRPLTPGEQSLLRYRGLAEELAALLLPFRRTRLRGHVEVQTLLNDRDTRPAVLADVLALEECAARLTSEYHQVGRKMDIWREQWARATQAQKHQLEHVEKALLISYYHDGLALLLKEAQADAGLIRAICPLAFAPPPVPVLAPAPYSA